MLEDLNLQRLAKILANGDFDRAELKQRAIRSEFEKGQRNDENWTPDEVIDFIRDCANNNAQGMIAIIEEATDAEPTVAGLSRKQFDERVKKISRDFDDRMRMIFGTSVTGLDAGEAK